MLRFCGLKSDQIGEAWRTNHTLSSHFKAHYDTKTCTAQKMKFSIGDFSVNVIKLAVSCGFGHIYWRNPRWKIHFLCSDAWLKFYSNTIESLQSMENRVNFIQLISTFFKPISHTARKMKFQKWNSFTLS